MEDSPGPLAQERDELSLQCRRLRAMNAKLVRALEELYSVKPGLIIPTRPQILAFKKAAAVLAKARKEG